MSVKIRPYRNGGYEVDIMIRLPNGQTHRERRKSPYAAKSASLRWGKERERHLLIHGLMPTGPSEADLKKEKTPTLAEFSPRYIEGYAVANGNKPSTIKHKRQLLRIHLIPTFGEHRLDQIDAEQVQRMKARLAGELNNKTINKILSVLNTMLKCAVEWGVLDELPVQIKRLREQPVTMDFYDFDEYAKLVDVAAKHGPDHLAFVLLAGDAGLRAGEIRGLHWTSVDLRRQQLTVERSEFEGEFLTPKYDKIRTVPMTRRLAETLRTFNDHERPLLFERASGLPITRTMCRTMLERAFRDAELRVHGPHSLRHTFCSHLAMHGAPARVIQQLAGHSSLVTTQRYMHLSPGATTAAIALLDGPPPGQQSTGPASGSGFGDMRETPKRRPPHTL